MTTGIHTFWVDLVDSLEDESTSIHRFGCWNPVHFLKTQAKKRNSNLKWSRITFAFCQRKWKIVAHGNPPEMKFKGMCEENESRRDCKTTAQPAQKKTHKFEEAS